MQYVLLPSLYAMRQVSELEEMYQVQFYVSEIDV
jgi:hypothetical protein